MFLTILNYFRQILVPLKYFVLSDWRIMVQKLPYNVKLKTQVVTDRVPSGFSGIRAAQSSVFFVVFFFRPLFIIFSFFDWPLHYLPVFDLWLPITLLTFLICWHIHAPLYYPNYQIYFIVVYMPRYFLWAYSILMQVKTLLITLVSCMLLNSQTIWITISEMLRKSREFA